jgi:hypothetical protein
LNKLYFGDNLDILRSQTEAESVDLIYLGSARFNSKRDYSVLFKTPKGHESDAPITAFENSLALGRATASPYQMRPAPGLRCRE